MPSFPPVWAGESFWKQRSLEEKKKVPGESQITFRTKERQQNSLDISYLGRIISQSLCGDMRISESYIPVGMSMSIDCPVVISMETFGLN